MLSYLSNLLFKRQSVTYRDTNNESNISIGPPLGVRIYLECVSDIADSNTEVRQWLQCRMNETVTSAIYWLNKEFELEKHYHSITGVALPQNGIIIYLPSYCEPLKTYRNGQQYLVSALSSVVTNAFRDHANRADFPADQIEIYQKIMSNYILACRFFYLDGDQPWEDAYNYILLTNINDQPINEDNKNEDEDKNEDEEDEDKNEDKEDEDNNEDEDDEDENNEDDDDDDEEDEDEEDNDNEYRQEWLITKRASDSDTLKSFKTVDLKFALVAKFLPIIVPN